MACPDVRSTISRIALGLIAAACSACWGSPSPLAPHLSGSIGVPHNGVVTNAAPLAKRGKGYERFRGDSVHYGHPRLVAAIEHAAASVISARPGSPPLVVGDLSERWGGQTERHRSHRSGRDVDLLFFATTPNGSPVKSPGFVQFGPDGLAAIPNDRRRFVRLDLDRNWLLVKSLIEAPEANVQWIFIARPLEALLIEHAIARGEEPELVWIAQTVMHQPGDSAPHDDHVHVRIACTPEEAVSGCEGGGPRWPWLSPLPALVATEAELIAALLDDGDAATAHRGF
jgi:penicillin-insensitive murein endopeptidase